MTTVMKSLFGNPHGEHTEEAIGYGQILFLVGYGQTKDQHDRLAVYEVEQGRLGTIYKCVNLDKFELRSKDHIRPIEKQFGIGTYYRKGDLATREEIEAALVIAKENKRKADEQREREAKVRKDKGEVAKQWWAENVPSWAKAFIVAELEEDCSDPMSDYFGSKTVRTMLMAFSESERNNFNELRAAAKNAQETAFLANMPKEKVEHREHYSGGAGYYLGEQRYRGWKLSKIPFRRKIGQGDFVADPENIKLPKEVENKVAVSADGKTACKINAEKKGIELYFSAKPTPEVLEELEG